ncbi:MAG TPA: hypothetical protein VMV92_00725 [Streptosporangiaceae bacterium]|nr:hypothetical protein [Streptosporangiaceae bacterium]
MSDLKRESRLPWSTAEDEVVRENYGQRTVAEITALLPGRSAKAVDNRAWRLGVSRRGSLRSWTASDLTDLRESYQNMTAAEISVLTGRTEGSVRQRATRLDIGKRAAAEEGMRATLMKVRENASRHPRRYTESIGPQEIAEMRRELSGKKPGRKLEITRCTVSGYFSSVTTAEQAYVLGLLVADGNIALAHPRVQFGLEAADARLVEFVRDRLNPAARLCARADGQMVVQITSRQLVADLGRYGVVPRKSAVTRWPGELGELLRPFLLGCFDGDGSAFLPRDRRGREYPGWSLCSGSRRFLEDARDYIEAATGVGMQKIQKRRDVSLWQVSVTGLGAIVVNEWLHQDGLGLARKTFPGRVLSHYGLA